MGAFNVVTATLTCPSCGERRETRCQFKFGDTWQHEYRIGANISWGGNDTGVPGLAEVVVDGATEGCSHCGVDTDVEIWIRNDQLVEVRPASGKFDLSSAPEGYVVLKNE